MSNKEAISLLRNLEESLDSYYGLNDVGKAAFSLAIEALKAQEKTDMISKQKVRYKLTALVNELEEIFAYIRERNEDDSVCGLCEYDGAYIGQSGDWCNECPGFDKADCFKLKDKYRSEWEGIDE